MKQAESVVVVVTGASPAAVREAAAEGRTVIAADGGLEAALAADVEVALLVGDLDSVGQAALDAAERAEIPTERHRPDKDATDLELALDAAVVRSARRVRVLGSDGGRLDHLLGAVLGLAADRYADVELDATLGEATIHVVRSDRTLTGAPGELLTLLAAHGPAEGVVTQGLRFPLRGETLEPGSSRGVSNVFEATQATIALARGVLLAVRPGNEEL